MIWGSIFTRRFSFMASILLSVAVSTSQASSVSWTNGLGSGAWGNVANWSSWTVPGSSDDVSFTQPCGAYQVGLLVDRSARSLNVSFDLSAGQIWNLASKTEETLKLTLASGQLTVTGTGGSRKFWPKLVIPSGVTDAQWNLDSAGALYINTITMLSSSCRLTKTGGSDVTLRNVTGGGTMAVRSGNLTITGMVNASVQMAPDAGLRCRLSGTGQIVSGVSLTNCDLVPGIAGGVLTTGGVTFGQGSVLAIDLLSSATANQGRLDANGPVAISQVEPLPALSLNLGFAPSAGQPFVILNNNSADPVNGCFAGLPEHGVVEATFEGQQTKFFISYVGGDGNDIVLTVAGGVLPGDANGDNLVDQVDYTVWYNSYGSSLTGPQYGDFDGSGMVDQADYTIWYNNYGQSGAGLVENTSVPEPCSLGIVVAGLLPAILRRRQASRRVHG